MLAQDFEQFCNNLWLDSKFNDMRTSIREIAKKLNQVYYELDNDTESHMYIVGSVGRKTAIQGSSDLDLLFDLPHDVYKRYNNYSNQKQSKLLQNLKEALQDRFSRTKIRGDGQVVVIEFNKFTVELVPGFKQDDGSFMYPDTNGGGCWKKTNPIKEQDSCEICNTTSNNKFYDFCHILRSWKNTIGFAIKGLLIDTLVYNFFKDNNYFRNNHYSYLEILILLFDYLQRQDKSRTLWFAPGSNQCVYNSDNGSFVKHAKDAYSIIKDITSDSDDANNLLRSLLGNQFPKNEEKSNKYAKNLCCDESFVFDKETPTEEFIEEKFTVDIRYDLTIDCEVTQNGWPPFKLRSIAKDKTLRKNKHLDFFVKNTDCPSPYDIYWKIRNVGPEAVKRNMIRGNIIKGTKDQHQQEKTDFEGSHYVECFIVKNDVCVAKDRIEVPIGHL